jgi:hypothetical protein
LCRNAISTTSIAPSSTRTAAWDRAEANGWYHHTIPARCNTPAHKILVHMATI